MGRVILDKKTFLEENYGDRIHLSLQELNDASQLMLYPPYTHSFSLILKQWCKFSIDSLSETNWDKSALDSVIIDEHRKDVLKALVLAHEFPSGTVTAPSGVHGPTPDSCIYSGATRHLARLPSFLLRTTTIYLS